MRSTRFWADCHDVEADDFPSWYQEDPELRLTEMRSVPSTDRLMSARQDQRPTPTRDTSSRPTGPTSIRPSAESQLGVDLRGRTLSTPTEDEEGEMTMAPPLLLTIDQAAKRLTVGRCTMQQLVLDKEVRSFKIGKLRRIPPEALDEYIARKMQP